MAGRRVDNGYDTPGVSYMYLYETWDVLLLLYMHALHTARAAKVRNFFPRCSSQPTSSRAGRMMLLIRRHRRIMSNIGRRRPDVAAGPSEQAEKLVSRSPACRVLLTITPSAPLGLAVALMALDYDGGSGPDHADLSTETIAPTRQTPEPEPCSWPPCHAGQLPFQLPPSKLPEWPWALSCPLVLPFPLAETSTSTSTSILLREPLSYTPPSNLRTSRERRTVNASSV
jgi:hypothetical protein